MQVVRCPRGDVAAHIAQADVLVPLMTRLDRELMQKASRARLILQYGVGLEGVDIPAVTIWTGKPLFPQSKAGSFKY